MDSAFVLTTAQQAMALLLTVAAPMLGVVLVVGLVVSVIQAITQVHEATLAFVPKLLAAIAVIAVAGPWMLTQLVDYLRRILGGLPGFVQ